VRHYFRLLGGADAVIAWLDEHGVKASPSDPGRIAGQILVSVGGVRGTALLADRDTLKLLDHMAKSVRRHADGTIEEFENRAIHVDRWKALVHRRTNAGPYRWVSLDAFVKKSEYAETRSVGRLPELLKKELGWPRSHARAAYVRAMSEAVCLPAGDTRFRVLSSIAPRSTGLIKACRRMIRLGGGTGNAVH
jgi:hypothetical protein